MKLNKQYVIKKGLGNYCCKYDGSEELEWFESLKYALYFDDESSAMSCIRENKSFFALNDCSVYEIVRVIVVWKE